MRQSYGAAVRAGLTFIDVIITVMIMGILATVAAPKFLDSLTRYKVEAAARQVAADLKHARHHAKTIGATQSVVFTPAADTYDLPGMNDINRAGQPFSVDLAKTGYAAQLVSVSFGPLGTDTTVVFDMYGRPDYGGSVVVQTGSEQRTIDVDGATGNVTIQP